MSGALSNHNLCLKVRLLYLHHNADTYGASRSLVRLLGKLPKNEFTSFVVLPEDGPLRAQLEAIGAKIVLHPRLSVINRSNFKSWRLLKFLLEIPFSVLFLWRLIRREKIDLVHTNTGVIVSGGLAAKLAGARHVWHIRDWFQEFKSLWKCHSKYILWSSQKVICVSNAMARQFPPSTKIQVIHNGFSLAEFAVPKEKLRAEFREKFQIGNEVVVGCVGRIKLVRKGQEILVQAAGLLAKKEKKPKFLIVGAPFKGNESHLEKLKDLAQELGITKQIVFTGEMADPRPAYAAMDIFILPSAQPEPFGGVVMEAMSMGLAVIATNIGGSTDQVAENVTGFLVPPNDPAALTEKIELLLDNPELRTKMGVAGTKRIAETFSLDEMVEKMKNLYLELGSRES